MTDSASADNRVLAGRSCAGLWKRNGLPYPSLGPRAGMAWSSDLQIGFPVGSSRHGVLDVFAVSIQCKGCIDLTLTLSPRRGDHIIPLWNKSLNSGPVADVENVLPLPGGRSEEFPKCEQALNLIPSCFGRHAAQ